MKTKQLIITILMITFVTMITTKVEATENDEQVEQTQNIENIEKDKQYNLTKEVKVKTLPLIFAIEKETIPSGNIRVTDILNDWCKIENEGKSGWIRINTIKTSVKQDNNQEEAKKEENLNTEGNNNQEQTNSSNEEESNQNPSFYTSLLYTSITIILSCFLNFAILHSSSSKLYSYYFHILHMLLLAFA